jgi:hypothetical protein
LGGGGVRTEQGNIGPGRLGAGVGVFGELGELPMGPHIGGEYGLDQTFLLGGHLFPGVQQHSNGVQVGDVVGGFPGQRVVRANRDT